MDWLGFLKDYLNKGNEENDDNVGNNGVDLEYNWHPVFLTQESRNETAVVAHSIEHDEYHFSGMFDENLEVDNVTNIPYCSMVVNQRMEECQNDISDNRVEKCSPITEEFLMMKLTVTFRVIN